MNNMLTQETQSPHVKALAERLVADIRRRGLGVGDRYLTTEEVSRSLGVGKAVAGKAMRHLAEREILISRQRSGTFIGPGVDPQRHSKLRTIFVLLPAGDATATHWSFHPFIIGIRKAIPDINVQFTFVPDVDAVPYVQELINTARSVGQFGGVVSVSCAPQVYRYLAELHVPAVVYGSLYSAELPITSVDVDSRTSGQLLTQYLIDRGHRRMAFVMAGGGRPGDNAFFDGISEALAASGLPHNALIQRLVRSDIEALRATARELLEDPGRPTAIITRGSIQVDLIASVAKELALAVPDDLEIVFDHEDQTLPRIDMSMYPHVEPQMSFVEIAETIGNIVKEMSEGIVGSPRRVMIPVAFHEPAHSGERLSS
jgi:DNA-binding LacI/PurR family transcriptional regulator